MKDWVTLITAIIQLLTALLLLSREKEKGTHKRRIRRRR